MTQTGKTIGILMTGHAVPQVLDALGDYDAMFARLLDGHGFTFGQLRLRGRCDSAAHADECDWLADHGLQTWCL